MAGEQFMIGGQLIEVPAEIEAQAAEHGRGILDAWYAEQDEPHAVQLAAEKKVDLKHPKLVRTGAGGRLLTSDVERLLIADQAEKDAAAAAAQAAKDAKKSTSHAPDAGTE